MNHANPNPPTSCSMHAPQTEDWLTTYGNSFFQFAYSESLSATSGVGTLTITDCTFQNFFYDFTSFIGLANGHGHVIVSGSTFTRFSNCGSIIRDTREYPALNYNEITLGKTANEYRESMLTSNILQEKYFVEPSTAWIDSSCTSIKIESCTFSEFNSMKPEITFIPRTGSTSKMVQQGKILSLENYHGHVVLKANTFERIIFKWQKWEIEDNSSTFNYVSDGIFNYGDGSQGIYQAKTLIALNVQNAAIEIYDNTFTSWNSLFGLIYLRRISENTGSILIHNNEFRRNSALKGSNVLKIYLSTTHNHLTEFTGTSMICANLKISHNTFTQNIGCSSTTGAIEVIWYSRDKLLSVLSFADQYPPFDYFKVHTTSEVNSKDSILAFNTENIM